MTYIMMVVQGNYNFFQSQKTSQNESHKRCSVPDWSRYHHQCQSLSFKWIIFYIKCVTIIAFHVPLLSNYFWIFILLCVQIIDNKRGWRKKRVTFFFASNCAKYFIHGQWQKGVQHVNKRSRLGIMSFQFSTILWCDFQHSLHLCPNLIGSDWRFINLKPEKPPSLEKVSCRVESESLQKGNENFQLVADPLLNNQDLASNVNENGTKSRKI